MACMTNQISQLALAPQQNKFKQNINSEQFYRCVFDTRRISIISTFGRWPFSVARRAAVSLRFLFPCPLSRLLNVLYK